MTRHSRYKTILFDGSHVFSRIRTQQVSHGTVLTVLRTVASYFQLGASSILLDMDFVFSDSASLIHLIRLLILSLSISKHWKFIFTAQ
jgi:hypothetical protein